jgi:hypothetical protein
VRSFIYWLLFALVVALVAYASLLSLTPLIFLFGGILLGLSYAAFLYVRYRSSGRWLHSRFQFRFYAALFTYIVLFWTTIGLLVDIEQRVFWARYEPYLEGGTQMGFTFHYLDHPGAWERVNSPELNRYLEASRPERVRLIVEVRRDLGRLRDYSLRGVDGYAVSAGWSPGNPPWEELRNPTAATQR